MTTLERLRDWQQTDTISDAQYRALGAIVRKDVFSVFLELNALLYIGVLSFVAGLGWTFRTYFAAFGDAAVLTVCTLLCGACLVYCFSRAAPYSNEEVESANLVFDYVLYLGCLVFSAELAYVEFRIGLLPGTWNSYLLLTAAIYAVLAYRFDNRFVLALALGSLGGWFGLNATGLAFRTSALLRTSALAYGGLVAAVGTALQRQRIKPHFLDAYLHIAANVVFAAVVSGIGVGANGTVYLGALVMLAIAAIVLGIRFGRFVFVAYGVVYGYIGISVRTLAGVNDATVALAYFVATGTLVTIVLATVARRFGRVE